MQLPLVLEARLGQLATKDLMVLIQYLALLLQMAVVVVERLATQTKMD
jgi:hypothetical protein